MKLPKPVVYINTGRVQCFKDGVPYYNLDFSAFGVSEFEVEDEVDAVVYWALDGSRSPVLRYTWVKKDPVWRQVDAAGEQVFLASINPVREPEKKAVLEPKMSKKEQQVVVNDVADAVLDKVDEGKSRRNK
jgi:uncharacterized protein with ATP-grasp and redox domains